MKPVMMVIIAAILFGFIGFFVRNIQDVSSYEIVMLRFVIGFLLVASLMLIIKRKPAKPTSKLLIVNSLITGVWVTFYISSIAFGTPLANAAFLLYTSTIFSVIFSRFILKEMISKSTMIVMVVAIAGVILILKPSLLFTHYGELMALMAGLIYGLNTVTIRKLERSFDTYSIVFYSFLIPMIFLIPMGLSDFVIPDTFSMVNLILLATVSTTIPVLLFTYSLKKLKAFETLTIGLTEPLVAALIGFSIFFEFLDVFSIIGGGMILFSSFYLNRKLAVRTKLPKI